MIHVSEYASLAPIFAPLADRNGYIPEPGEKPESCSYAVPPSDWKAHIRIAARLEKAVNNGDVDYLKGYARRLLREIIR